jgi:DNA-binding NtrC family response regulator
MPALSPSAAEMLQAYAWPGNVRELRNVIERAAILCPTDAEILPAHLAPLGALFGAKLTTGLNLSHQAEGHALAPSTISGAREHAERQLIEAALKKNNRNVAATARELKITRETLYQKMKKYRLPPEG